jgi:hypothetical protein
MRLNFHHAGVACQDLDLETGRFAALPYAQEETDFSDSIQEYTDEFPCISLSCDADQRGGHAYKENAPINHSDLRKLRRYPG